MVLGNYHEMDSLEYKKADVFARMWLEMGSGGSAGEARSKEVSSSIVLLIGGKDGCGYLQRICPTTSDCYLL